MLGDVHTQPVSIIAVALIGKPVAIVDKGVVFVIVLFDVWVDLDLIRILVYVYKVQDLRFLGLFFGRVVFFRSGFCIFPGLLYFLACGLFRGLPGTRCQQKGSRYQINQKFPCFHHN